MDKSTIEKKVDNLEEEIKSTKTKQADLFNKMAIVLGRLRNEISGIKVIVTNNTQCITENRRKSDTDIKDIITKINNLEKMAKEAEEYIEEQKKKEIKNNAIKDYIKENKEKIAWILGIIGSIVAIVFTIMGHYK